MGEDAAEGEAVAVAVEGTPSRSVVVPSATGPLALAA
jgi:hypothetical protein